METTDAALRDIRYTKQQLPDSKISRQLFLFLFSFCIYP